MEPLDKIKERLIEAKEELVKSMRMISRSNKLTAGSNRMVSGSSPLEKDEDMDAKIRAKIKIAMDKRNFSEADATKHVIDRDIGNKQPKAPKPLLQSEDGGADAKMTEMHLYAPHGKETTSGDTENSETVCKDEKPFLGYNKKKHSKEGGLSESYRKKYNKENGSNLKKPVTSSEAKGSDKKAGRRKSFCARMSGVSGPTSKDGELTRKGAALNRWDCSKSDEVLKTDKNGQWTLDKSNYGPKDMGLYNQNDNANRKANNTNDIVPDAGKNVNVKSYTTTGSSTGQAASSAEAKRQTKANKIAPVKSLKDFSTEEIADMEAKRNK